LAVILFSLLTAPILLSTAHAILVVTLASAGSLLLKARQTGHQKPLELISYLFGRSHELATVFLNQRDVTTEAERWRHWTPPIARRYRDGIALALLASLYAVLITGLTYYCPWEVFAGLFVPDFRTNMLFIPDETPQGYDWIRLPFSLAFEAKPLAGYMLTYVFAIVGFLFLPPVVLFAVYFDQLVALEGIYQKIKAIRRADLSA
jgi:hypothetical protein